MTTHVSKFNQLHENVYSRYVQGAGFLAGDKVKFKKNVLKSEWFLNKAQSIQDLVKAMMETPGNLRIGVLKNEFPLSIGSYAAADQPAVTADIYVELSPANWAYPMTVPLQFLERIEPTSATLGGDVPKNIKDKKRTQIKGAKKDRSNTTQTKVDDFNREGVTTNKTLPGGKKWDDSKVGGGNLQTMPKTNFKESTTLEDIYTAIHDKKDITLISETLNEVDDFDNCDVQNNGNTATVTFKDTVYNSIVDDEVPVTVVANFSYSKDKPVDNFKLGWVLSTINVTGENGKPLTLKPVDQQYLKDRATDFIYKHNESTEMVDEALDSGTILRIGSHSITRKESVVNKEDPTKHTTYTFDNGYNIRCFWGYELNNPSGIRVAFTENAKELNPLLRKMGLPTLDEISHAFNEHDNTNQLSPEDAAADHAMGDIRP